LNELKELGRFSVIVRTPPPSDTSTVASRGDVPLVDRSVWVMGLLLAGDGIRSIMARRDRDGPAAGKILAAPALSWVDRGPDQHALPAPGFG
jgi:hypothetical protein